MPLGLRTSDYDFDLPEELIAQAPLERRDASRLMVVHRATGSIEHKRFTDLANLLEPPDLLVVNRSRVVRARLLGRRFGSGARAEIFLLSPLGGDRYEALVSPGGKLKPGRAVEIAPGFTADILSVTERRTRVVQLTAESSSVEQAIETHGHIPLPPYITRMDEASDVERYQTVYAREAGSVAAPTAGLHFTPEVLERCREAGATLATVTLHVGLGTFQPLHEEVVEAVKLHSEHYRISADSAAAVDAAKRVVAVGTTSVRTLETVARTGEMEGETAIFLYPGVPFLKTGAMLTNFHLPRTSLLLLVCAFGGTDLILGAYRHAVEAGYRFYSYGDCMLIV